MDAYNNYSSFSLSPLSTPTTLVQLPKASGFKMGPPRIWHRRTDLKQMIEAPQKMRAIQRTSSDHSIKRTGLCHDSIHAFQGPAGHPGSHQGSRLQHLYGHLRTSQSRRTALSQYQPTNKDIFQWSKVPLARNGSNGPAGKR